MKTNIITAALLAVLSIPASAVVNIDYVAVGNAGNVGGTFGRGAVEYQYNIGKYEVTIGQYSEFLNHAAKSDPYGLYTSSMASNMNVAGISRSGSSGSYTYTTINSANRPISYVSWYDAARFTNWIHNGQGSGSTETGVYDLGGATSGTFAAQPGATVWLPTTDEWYKAAFYDPTPGASGDNYWLYPTQSDTAPGNIIGNSPNQANYWPNVLTTTQSPIYSQFQNYLTDVGAFGSSASFYGTYDQGGNVSEWISDPDFPVGTNFGGNCDSGAGDMQPTMTASADPEFGQSRIGFRLAAAIPEPTTGLLAILGLLPLLLRRRKA